jgi:hypothetical protein
MVTEGTDGPGPHKKAPGPTGDGACVIRIALKRLLQAAALSLGLVWGGAYVLSASAQSSPAAGTPAAKASAPQAKATPIKTAEAKPAQPKPAKKKTPAAKTPKTLDEAEAAKVVSETVVDLARWVIASGDNRELPFAIVDKEGAQIMVFAADGKLRGFAPALIGSAAGDDSAPGVGDRELNDIPAGDRTTPAGRFLAAYGPAEGGKSVLWVDYATSISIHALPATRESQKEKRKERLASKDPADNRITHGCINVSSTFYTKIIRPTFKEVGVFYVLPELDSLQTAFPAFEPPDLFDSQTASNDTGDVGSVAR